MLLIYHMKQIFFCIISHYNFWNNFFYFLRNKTNLWLISKFRGYSSYFQSNVTPLKAVILFIGFLFDKYLFYKFYQILKKLFVLLHLLQHLKMLLLKYFLLYLTQHLEMIFLFLNEIYYYSNVDYLLIRLHFHFQYSKQLLCTTIINCTTCNI